MPFLIDGHNLIGQMSVISLADPQDEQKLVGLLDAFCARRSTTATVYFDRGAPGATSLRASPRITCHFIRPPASADAAIERHVHRLGREAPNWTVVSSDREVARAARQGRARIVSSAEFARLLEASAEPEAAPEKPEDISDAAELSRWRRLFATRRRRP